MTKQLLSEIAQEAKDFMLTRRSLELSTVNPAGEPLASYAPFFRTETGDFYIFVSALAAHTKNLDSPTASILVIDDEQNTQQIYVRLRLSFQCSVTHIPREHPEFEIGFLGLKAKHGEVVTTLSELADFKMIKLSPTTGRFIKGFGQAYLINPELTEVSHISVQSA